jgi:hypothetical protein
MPSSLAVSNTVSPCTTITRGIGQPACSRPGRTSSILPTLIARRRSSGIAARLQSRVRFDYTVEVLEELQNRGVVPTGETDPQLVRDFLSALYRYEIRRLKGRLLSGEFPQREYASRVRALRREYVLLSIPLETWTRPG